MEIPEIISSEYLTGDKIYLIPGWFIGEFQRYCYGEITKEELEEMAMAKAGQFGVIETDNAIEKCEDCVAGYMEWMPGDVCLASESNPGAETEFNFCPMCGRKLKNDK